MSDFQAPCVVPCGMSRTKLFSFLETYRQWRGNAPAIEAREVWIQGEMWQVLSLSKSSLRLHLNSLRVALAKFVGHSPSIVITQIIGDSAVPFSAHGTLVARRFLDSVLNPPSRGARILWGLTGTRSTADGGCDTNQVVNDWIDSDPLARSPIAFANIVDLGTARVLLEEGCQIPSVFAERRNFILLHGGAEFGDDIAVSDMLTNELVILEGGVQCFEQFVSCIQLPNIRVRLLTNLRRSDEAFSAARLIVRLIGVGSGTEAERVKSAYLDSCSGFHGNHRFASAWSEFVDRSLWRLLIACTVEYKSD